MSSAELLGESVYTHLLERVLDGRLRPGTVLSVAALAVELGVSRSPVRESVQRLVTEGIAVASAHSAARVATVGPAELEEVLRVREVLEGLAAAQATTSTDAEGVRLLLEAVQEHEGTLDAPPDPVADAAFDVRFHTLLRQLSGNATLADTLRRLEVRSHLFGAGLWTDRRHRVLAVAEHRRIAEAVEAGDVEGARRDAAAHVAALAVRLRRSTS